MNTIITLKIGKYFVDFLLSRSNGNWTIQHMDSDLLVASGWIADKMFGIKQKDDSLFFIHDALFDEVSKILKKCEKN